MSTEMMEKGGMVFEFLTSERGAEGAMYRERDDRRGRFLFKKSTNNEVVEEVVFFSLFHVSLSIAESNLTFSTPSPRY